MQVLIKILVLIGSYMIRRKIRKNSQIKHKACSPVQHQSLRRDLHYHCLHTAVSHIAESFLNLDRLRRRIRRRDPYFPVPSLIERLDRTDQTCPYARGFQDRPDHISRCRLSFSPRYTYGLHLACGIIIKSSGNDCHCQPRILDTDDHRALPVIPAGTFRTAAATFRFHVGAFRTAAAAFRIPAGAFRTAAAFIASPGPHYT